MLVLYSSSLYLQVVYIDLARIGWHICLYSLVSPVMVLMLTVQYDRNQ